MLPRIRGTCWTGTSTGTPRSTPIIRRSGNGSSAANSTPATTASTAIWPSTRTKPRSSSSPSRKTKPPRVITYQELYKRVNEVAAMLRDFAGLKAGDRVTIHMPMIPGAADHHAGLRAAGRHPLRGLRRIQRRSLRPARRRFRQPRADLRRRLPPQRQVGRSQSQRRHRRRNRQKRRPAHRQSSGLEALSTATTLPNRR